MLGCRALFASLLVPMLCSCVLTNHIELCELREVCASSPGFYTARKSCEAQSSCPETEENDDCTLRIIDTGFDDLRTHVDTAGRCQVPSAQFAHSEMLRSGLVGPTSQYDPAITIFESPDILPGGPVIVPLPTGRPAGVLFESKQCNRQVF